MGWPKFIESIEKHNHAAQSSAHASLQAVERLQQEANGKGSHPQVGTGDAGAAPIVHDQNLNLAGPVNLKAVFRTANHLLFDSGGIKDLHKASLNNLRLSSTIVATDLSRSGHSAPGRVSGQVTLEHSTVTEKASLGQGQPVAEQVPEAPSPDVPKASIWSSPAGRVASGAMGVFGIVGGGWQVKHGFDLYSSGRTAEGSLTAVGGLANMTAGGSAFFATSTLAQTIGLRAAAVGAVIDGGMLMHRGYRTGDGATFTDGFVRFGAGGTMLVGGPIGMGGAAVYGGWSVGRLAGEHVSWGGRTLDQHTTAGLDSVMNLSANYELSRIELRNSELLVNQSDVIGASLAQLQVSGKSMRDVSEAIIGLHEDIERETDQSRRDSKQQEIKRLIAIRRLMTA